MHLAPGSFAPGSCQQNVHPLILLVCQLQSQSTSTYWAVLTLWQQKESLLQSVQSAAGLWRTHLLLCSIPVFAVFFQSTLAICLDQEQPPQLQDGVWN